jgi:hypothetical protein
MPGLSEKDAAKVALANELLRFMTYMCKYATRRRVPWYIENPWSSRLWLTDEMLSLESLPGTCRFQVDHCQFGEPCRKSTRILVNGHSDMRGVQRKCKFGRGYVCSATGRRHIQLCGVDKSGTFMTARAQAYPKRLCRALAGSIREHVLDGSTKQR